MLRAALDQKHAEYEDLQRHGNNTASNLARMQAALAENASRSADYLRKAIKAEAEVERLRADAEFGARWRQDSSLATWFPITAEKMKPLTNAQITACVIEAKCHGGAMRMAHESGPYSITQASINAIELTRAIERAHGILA